jgi:uncharacterized protein (TIGR02145 family)
MKKLFISLALILASILSIQAQVPQGFNYQATVRNSGGELIVNQDVNFKFNVQQGSATSESVYTETHLISTDDLGQINLTIGNGTALSGVFKLIDWSLGSYFLGIQLDTGTGYVAMGTTQLLSVPYALYAENSGSAASDLQGVLDVDAAANMVVNEANLSGIKLSTTGGDTADNYYNGISSSINGTNGRNVAVNGESNGINLFRNYGFRGVASNAQNLNTGVQGIANSETGNNYAVWGIASNATDGNDNRGVIGYAKTTTATGINYGVTGYVGGSEVVNIALGGYASADDSTNGSNFGVDAKAEAVTVNGINYGVYSQASNAPNNYGIHSRAVGTVGANYGIHASASGGDLNYAGYFVGDVMVTEGTLTADIALASAPTAEMDAVNKGYVDQVIAELRTEIQILKSEVEGNLYSILTYGTQQWSASNAFMESYRDGTPIPHVTETTLWNALTTGAWCYSNNDPTKSKLYNWYAVAGIHDNNEATPNKEFAPVGWHVPSSDEWMTLQNHLVDNGFNYDNTSEINKIGKAMASTTGWSVSTNAGAVGNNQITNNSSGFNAIPTGFRGDEGEFFHLNFSAGFWTSTEESTNTNFAKFRYLGNMNNFLGDLSTYKSNGDSVRLIRN